MHCVVRRHLQSCILWPSSSFLRLQNHSVGEIAIFAIYIQSSSQIMQPAVFSGLSNIRTGRPTNLKYTYNTTAKSSLEKIILSHSHFLNLQQKPHMDTKIPFIRSHVHTWKWKWNHYLQWRLTKSF